MNIYELRNGMLITHQGEVARVEKVKQKRLIVLHEDGRRYDTWPVHCSPAPEGAAFNLKVEEAKGVTLGTVVRFKGGTRVGPYVCVALSGSGEYRLAKLGGDGGQYVYNVAATSIEVMDLEELRRYLLHVA
jgi:hypothetical protein